MPREIDINKSIFELCNEYPEIPEILSSLGFKDITKPGMISTAGRFMTLPKGAKAKGIDLEKIKQEFIRLGYEIKE
jgi:selenophosphate synthetase-related protein